MRIIWSFNKRGSEAAHWEREIVASGNGDVSFCPFNHGRYLDVSRAMDAWRLDRLYRDKDPEMELLQARLREEIERTGADALCVTNCPPYHPDFLRTLPLYKALYSTDDPEATYKRTIPYIHAYDHVLFCAPGYSRDMSMFDKMRYSGATRLNWLPLGVFDFEGGDASDEASLFSSVRDVDIVYVGAFWRQKIEMLMRVGRSFGRRFVLRGFFLPRHNLYINVRYGALRVVRSISFEDRVRLYRRSRIGINMHWNQYGVGNQRLYHLPANGVMQLCDGPGQVDSIFEVGREIACYRSIDELIDLVRWYLDHDAEREAVARAAYRRVAREYRIGAVLRRAADYIRQGMTSTPDRMVQTETTA